MIKELLDLIKTAFLNLGRAKTRTFLTLAGVIIGIAAIVSLTSIGAGLNDAVETQLNELGTNTIFVIPGGSSYTGRTTITNADLSFMENIIGTTNVAPIYSGSAILEVNNQKVNVSVTAVDASDASIFDNSGTFEVSEGRDFSQNESGSVLIGNKVAYEFFDKKIETRKIVKINGEEFKVIGILKPQSQSFGGGFNGSSTVFMSLDAFKRITTKIKPGIIFVKTSTKEVAPSVATTIKDYFEEKYGEDAVNVFTSEQILEQVNQLLNLITIFLVGVGGIAILVGGVGILNSMVTSVLERTKEIGVMKALGASNNMVLALFLIEAGFIGAIGGVLGVIVGYTIAILVAFLGQLAGFALNAGISIEITLGAIIFSILVGMGSGFFPALRAANMDPVRALRYE